jgi:hypothetical protein
MKNSILLHSGRILIAILFCSSFELMAQDHLNESQEGILRHKLFAQYGLVHIPEGHEEGGNENNGILIASYGLGYIYRINHKWALGIELNLEGGEYIIKEDIPRENAFLIAIVGAYELMPSWGLFFGGGIEIEKHKNYALVRVGTEYIFPIGRDWALTPLLTFDHKIDYTSWEVALMLSKSF